MSLSRFLGYGSTQRDGCIRPCTGACSCPACRGSRDRRKLHSTAGRRRTRERPPALPGMCHAPGQASNEKMDGVTAAEVHFIPEGPAPTSIQLLQSGHAVSLLELSVQTAPFIFQKFRRISFCNVVVLIRQQMLQRLQVFRHCNV